MATTTKSINATMTYGDYTTRTYKIPWQDNTDVVDKIKAFNTAASTENSSVKQTFLSENGVAVTGITKATTIRRTEEELYHA